MSTKADTKIALAIGRSNLLLISRLVLRGLLENCMQLKCRMLHSEHQQLQDFFIIVEKVLRHGFKASRNFVSLKTPDQELWSMIERLGKLDKEVEEAVQCVDQLPNVHSPLCRIRSWLRLAIMQKKLSDYFNILIEAKQILKEYYDDWALLRHETDAVIFSGSLIGLRVLDCNLYLKEDDLNYPHFDVDLNLYIKLPSIPVEEVLEHDVDASTSNVEANNNNPDMKTILDQKHYLEERNRALMSNIENLQQRLSMLEEMQKHRKSTTGGEDAVKGLPIEVRNIDMSSLNKVEEMETAMALLEKSVHEKQDTIVSLRQQIDDIKKINLDLYQKLRTAEETGKSLEKATSKLQLELDASRNHSQNKISHLEIRPLPEPSYSFNWKTFQELTVFHCILSLIDTERRLKKSEDFVATLQFELNQKTDFSSKLQNELLELKDMVNFLTDSLKAERMVREDLDAQLQNSKNTEQNYSKVKMEKEALQRKIMGYERTLEELGVTLSKSKLEVDCLKEDMAPLVDAQWESDKETTSCKTCQQKFSLSRRKHHCRNCGGIFCNACSENTMPLPSSAKPVRVCDQCYAVLLQRFSTKNLPSQSENAPED